MAVVSGPKIQVATISEFNGLRTDLHPVKCPPSYSPDCGDMQFTPGGMSTRLPFRRQFTLPNAIVWDEQFICRDGSEQELALDITGALYLIAADGTNTILDTVFPGSSCNSVVAYGRIYMAFFNSAGGSDAPRQWDGKKLTRVSRGGPGAPPTVTNLALPLTSISAGSRSNNVVTLTTNTPNMLKQGYLATIANVAAFIENITSIVIDVETLPGIAVVTVPSAHGLVPGNSVSINDVQPVSVGGSFVSWNRVDTIVTVVTSANHGLQIGSTPLVELNSDGYGPVVVTSVPSLTSFTFSNPGGNGSGTTGGILLPWPLADGTLFTVTSVPSSTTFQVQLNFTDSTYTTGNIAFDWNGPFFVESVVSPTTFTYRQIGPNATISSGGTVTPTGQIPAGDHLVCQHFITSTGFITEPSPYVRFTASGGQYMQVSNLAQGSSYDIVARLISCTGANGSAFAYLDVPAQVSGQQVSTSTRINDNLSTSVVLDFSDVTLLSASASRIDIPGNNLFEQVTLNTPRGVGWYGDRLHWMGELNVVEEFPNLGIDGGTTFGSARPLGWIAVGTPAVTQVGTMPALTITGPDTGEIYQSAAFTPNGTPILQATLNYSVRVWATPKFGQFYATLSSVSGAFTATASIDLTSQTSAGYFSAAFSLPMPATIPADMILDLQVVNIPTGSVANYRDVQIIFTDNPFRNPLARMSYVQNPEAYDLSTGNIGPNDDPSELRATFVLQESLHFITAEKLHSVQAIGNTEPSSWDVTRIDEKCGTFNANSVTTGRGWATWSGKFGNFWYTGGLPQKTTTIIDPTYRKFTGVTNIYDDAAREIVFYGFLTGATASILAYDYHEVASGGSGKWCVWNRPVSWMSLHNGQTSFAINSTFYELDTVPDVADDDLGPIGGYYVTSAFNFSLLQRQYNDLGLYISGVGPMTPQVYLGTYPTANVFPLNTQALESLSDVVCEYKMLGLRARTAFLKLGNPGVQYTIEEIGVLSQTDPNAPLSGFR